MPLSTRARAGPISVAALLLLLLLAGGLVFVRTRAGAPGPNIILVVWDTCRGDRATVNGYAYPTTPRLEEFAREATTFR